MNAMVGQFNIFNRDGSVDMEMLNIAARACHKAANDADMEIALQLSAAGWQAELGKGHSPHPFTGCVDVMSWYWRRPARGKGRRGRLFMSTNQAWNAYQREKSNNSATCGALDRDRNKHAPGAP